MTTDLKEILRPLEGLLKSVGEYIISRLSTGIPVLDESARHLFISGGKMIRASLVILCSGLKSKVPDGIIEIAAAFEIVHAATLIHDDIIDKSFLRRGNITVPEKWGDKVAVLSGDYMYTLGLDIAVSDGNPALLPVMVEGSKALVQGELYQLQYSDINSITREHYYKIIELKTAKFMAVCAKIGAMKASLTPEECKELYDFGLNLGFAFQIVDDTLDMIESVDLTGKDAGNDFMDGTITLPFLYLLEKLSKKEEKIFREYAAYPDDSNWEIVRNKIKESGAIEYSLEAAEKYIEKAMGNISKFPDSEFKKILIDLTNFCIDRKY